MFKKGLFVFLCAVILFSQAAHGNIMIMPQPSIDAAGLSIGQTFDLKDDNDTPLVITNTGTEPVTVKINVIIPRKKDMVRGYEPIPDTGWVTPAETEITIPVKGKVPVDVTIEIPNEEKYKGKAYHASIWAHTVGGQAIFGTRAQLFITIAE